MTDRVVRLRPWREEDAPALVAAWRDADVRRWSPAPPAEYCTEEYASRWIAGTEQRRVDGISIDLVISSELDAPRVARRREVRREWLVLGEVGLGPIDWSRAVANVGWWVAPVGRGRGLATRAVRLLAGWAKAELGLDVVASVDPANAASARVAQRAGVQLVDRL